MPERDEQRQAGGGGAERLLRVLRDAAEDFGAGETLSGLGDRARSMVEEAVRGATAASASAGTAAASAGTAAEETASRADSASPHGIDHRLDELRSCVDEVADLLDAGLERLETLEMQLGDPDDGVERLLAEGIERCERVLGGVEHRILGIERGLAPVGDHDRRERLPAPSPVRVLVVAASSARRAELCLALERQGLRTMGAPDTALALRWTERFAPDAALVDSCGAGELLDEWAGLAARGLLPAAAVLLATDHPREHRREIEARGLAWIEEQHGPAATTASLRRLFAGAGAAAAGEGHRHDEGGEDRERGLS